MGLVSRATGRAGRQRQRQANAAGASREDGHGAAEKRGSRPPPGHWSGRAACWPPCLELVAFAAACARVEQQAALHLAKASTPLTRSPLSPMLTWPSAHATARIRMPVRGRPSRWRAPPRTDAAASVPLSSTASFVTARMHDIDPQDWLADVLARIAERSVQKLDEPLRWNCQNPNAVHDAMAA